MNKAWVRGEGGQAESGALQPIADRLAGPAQELVLLLEELEGLDPEGYLSAVDVLVPLAKEANARLHSAGVLGFDALLKGAQRLLMRPGVSARVRHRLDQLLVDEFQDTDSVQCSLIRSLTMQGPKEEHPGLFIVGDPKQSIYGWRSADLEAYEDFVAELTRHGALHHSLVQNFRSVGGILSEVDRCMTHMMISKPGVQPEYEGLIAARGPGPSGPSVEAWVSWEWEDGEAVVPTPAVAARQVEAKALAGDLFRLQEEGTSLGSIGVLFRSMTHIDVYQRALRDHGISYEVTRDRQYFRRSEIVEAAAMVRCLLDPLDSIALVTFLRSSMVQLPDAALMPLWGERFPKVWMELGVGSDAVARANQCIEQVFPMVSQLESDIPGLGSVGEWRTHLRNVVASVDRLRRSVKSEGFDLWVQDARRTFYTDVLGGVAYQGAYRVANLEQFFRQIVRDAKDNRGDLRSLSRSLREAVGQQQEAEEARPSQSGNAVQLMTIHKAKGLAFEHTYMVDLHHRIRGSERPRGTVCDPSFGIQLLGMWPPGFRYHWAKAERVAGAERVRLLYVAMTRARDRLVWMGAWPAELREGPRPRMLLDLFSARNPPLSNPMDLVGELSGSAEVVRGDIRWVFPGRMESSAPQAKSGEASLNQEFTVIAQGASEDALRLSQRPWTQGPSSATETTAGIGGKLSRTDALLVGTAIHWMLERLPKTEKITSELSREQLERALLLAADGGAISKAARERALVLLERVQLGGLIHHFENVEVLGQEVPLLLAPEDVGPIGAWVGSIDLLYRGPDGLYVVADYKTEQSGDRSSLEIGGHHAAQGRLYVEAVKKSLKLNYAPKFEIWLLERDERIIVDVD
jgi:ATP-dependent helicase/nuclease subunit A